MPESCANNESLKAIEAIKGVYVCLFFTDCKEETFLFLPIPLKTLFHGFIIKRFLKNRCTLNNQEGSGFQTGFSASFEGANIPTSKVLTEKNIYMSWRVIT